jgi:hypothetical protein
VLDPPGAQIGLHYGKSVELRVRYRTDDAAEAPLSGQTVRFSIFADPAGSTLARDQATTDPSGVATVTLTAGQAEASFRVVATAINAPEAEFDVSVSKLDFVALDVQLAWSSGDPTATTLRALLYDDRDCAALPAAATQPAPFRALSKAGAAEATLEFHNLLSKRYAVVGRAEGGDGHLAGYGCVDVGAELIPPGSSSTLPVPLAATVASPAGSYSVTSTLHPAMSLWQAPVAIWQTFGGCRYGAAQMLLDAMGLGSDATHRDPPGADGCRPTSATSLDKQLPDLLTAPAMAPATLLPAIADDLQQITTVVQLASRLTIAPAGGGTFVGEHALESATFNAGTLQQSYDLVQLGLPLVDVKDLAVGDDGATLTLGAHDFTLGWTTLWKQAFIDLSLSARVAMLGSPPIQSLVQRVVAVASRNGKMGCAAVDDLVCSVTTGSASCTLPTPCAGALAPLAATLEAPLAPSSGIDLTLQGTAQPIDQDGDLQVDQLAAGAWSAPELSAAPGDNPFSATRP